VTELATSGQVGSVVHADQLIAFVAARQHGVIARDQLVALGLGRGAIAHRVKRAALHRVHRGVYLWGHEAPAPYARALAAVLACGAGSVVSHDSAAVLWGIRPPIEGPIDVTLAADRVRQDGIRSHRTTTLHPADTRTLRGIAITSPARTLLDIAPQLAPPDLAAAVERAQVKRLVTKRDIAAAMGRAPRRAGASALRALVDEPAFTRSAAERCLLALLRAAKLPLPAFNARAEGYEVDALWRAERVVLEFDSYEFHATRAAFERDRRRDAAHTRARYVVLRTTWRELTGEPCVLVARIAETLALAQARHRAEKAVALGSAPTR